MSCVTFFILQSQEANDRLAESVDQVRAEAPEAAPLPSSIFPPFSEANANTSAASCNQSNDFNDLLASGKDSMMENMGYDGHDVQNQVFNVRFVNFCVKNYRCLFDRC